MLNIVRIFIIFQSLILGTDCFNDYKQCEACESTSNSGKSLFISSSKKECVEEICPYGEFISPTPGVQKCDKCDENCLKCSGNASFCTRCDPQGKNKYLLESQGICYQSCPEGYYNRLSSILSVCLPCQSSCQTCGNIRQCLSCPTNLYLNSTSSLCQECDIEDGFFIDSDSTCSHCHPKCLTCEGTKRDNCLSCRDPSTLTSYSTCREQSLNPLKVTNSTYSDTKFTVDVRFNQKLSKHLYNRAFEVSLEEKGKVEKMDPIFEPSSSNLYGFLYKIKFTRKISDGTLKFKNIDFSQIQGIEGEENYFFDDIRVNNINNKEEARAATQKSIKKSGGFIIKFVTIGSMLISFPQAVALVKLFQMIDYFTFLNIRHSAIFLLIVRTLSNNIFNEIPNLFTVLTDDNCQPLEHIYIENGMECQFYGNTGPIFLILIFFFLFKYAIKLYSWRTTSGDRLWPYQKPFYWLNQKISFEFIFDLVNMFQLDLYLAATLNILKYDFSSKNSIFNFASSIFAYLFLLSCNIFLFLATIKGEQAVYKIQKFKKENILEERDKTILEEVKEFNHNKRVAKMRKIHFGTWFAFKYLSAEIKPKDRIWYRRFYKPIIMLRDPLLSVWLVVFMNIPIIQVLGPFLLILVYLSLEVYYLPQDSIKDTSIEIFNQVVYTLSNFIFLVNSFNIIGSEKVRDLLLGWPSAFLLVLLMAVNMGVGIVFGFISLIQMIKNLFKRKNKKNKVVSQDTILNENEGLPKIKKTFKNNGNRNKVRKNPLNLDSSIVDNLNK